MDRLNVILRLLLFLIPWIVFFVVFKAAAKDKKDFRIEEPSGCFREPKESEIIKVKEKLLPARAKTMVIANIVMLFIDAFFIYSFIYQKNENAEIGRIISMGLMAFASVAVHIGVFSHNYGLYREINRERFTVSDARIVDVNVYYRRQGFLEKEYCRLLLRTPDGVEEEYALPKGEKSESVPVGSSCLIVRYEKEDTVNRNRNSGHYVKSRSVVL